MTPPAEAIPTPQIDLPEPSGYSTHDEYFATRFEQGGREIYSIDLSVPQLVATLPEPNPDQQTPGNRKINPAHARGFAEYIRERSNWVCPSLLLRAPEGEFDFRPLENGVIGGSELGILAVPRLSRESLQVVDGQHRTLGFHMAWKSVSQGIQEEREGLTIARRNGPPENVKEAERRLEQKLALRDRLAQARVSIDILIVDDPDAYKQVFVDIADNAKGVTRTLGVRFDRRKVVNRALPLVMEHTLVEGRVEEESDRLSNTNANLLTAKHLADIVRTVEVGVSRRISKRLEDELVDRQVAERTMRFLDVLVDSFPEFQAIEKGELSSPELRRSSLLGSSTMLRVLAGVYHDLTINDEEPGDRMSDGEVTGFLKKLAPHMYAPISEDGAWKATGVFMDSGMAPQSSQGDVRKLTNTIVDLGKNPPGWLS